MDIWSSVEERERKKKDNDKQHISFLANQRRDDRIRKLEGKRNEVDEVLYSRDRVGQRNPSPANQPDSLAGTTANALKSGDADDVYRVDKTAIRALKDKLALYEQEYLPNAPQVGTQNQLQLVQKPPVPAQDVATASYLAKSVLSPTESPSLRLELVQSKLEISQQMLENERKARQTLESQFQVAQAQLYSALAQIDSIKLAINQDQLVKSSLNEKVASIEQKIQSQTSHEETLLKQAMAAVSSRTVQLERDHCNQESQTRQMDQELKIAKQALFSATNELQQLKHDLSARMTAVEASQQQQQSHLRAFQAQENTIAALKSAHEQSMRQVDEKMGLVIQEQRRQADYQQSIRPGMEERLSESIRKFTVERNELERTWLLRFEGFRSQIETATDQQRLESHSSMSSYQQRLQELQQAVNNQEVDMEERLMKQIMNALSATEAENQARVKFQQVVEREIQQVAAGVIQQSQRQVDELRKSQRQQDTVYKAKLEKLEETLLSTSKAADSKLVEVKKRSEDEALKLKESLQKLTLSLETLQESTSKSHGQIQDLLQASDAKQNNQADRLRQEVKLVTEQLVQHQVKILKDMDIQLASLQRRVAEEASLNGKLRHSLPEELKKAQVASTYSIELLQKQVTDTSGDLFKKLKTLEEATAESLRQTKHQLDTFEKHYKLKQTQIDQTLVMFKEEFRSKISVNELKSSEERALKRAEVAEELLNNRLTPLEALSDWINQHKDIEVVLSSSAATYKSLQQANDALRSHVEDLVSQLSQRLQNSQAEVEGLQSRLFDIEKVNSEVNSNFQKVVELSNQRINADLESLSREVNDRALNSQVEASSASIKSDLYRISTQLETSQWIVKELTQRTLHLEERVAALGNKSLKTPRAPNLTQQATYSGSKPVQGELASVERELKMLKTIISRQEQSIENLVRQRQSTTEKQVALLEKDLIKLKMGVGYKEQPNSESSSDKRFNSITNTQESVLEDIDSPILQPIKTASQAHVKNLNVLYRQQSGTLRPSESQVSELNLDNGWCKGLGQRYSATFRKPAASSSDSLELRSGIQSQILATRLVKGTSGSPLTQDTMSPSRLFANTSLASVHKRNHASPSNRHRRRASSIPKFLSSPNSISNSAATSLHEISNESFSNEPRESNFYLPHSYSESFKKVSLPVLPASAGSAKHVKEGSNDGTKDSVPQDVREFRGPERRLKGSSHKLASHSAINSQNQIFDQKPNHTGSLSGSLAKISANSKNLISSSHSLVSKGRASKNSEKGSSLVASNARLSSTGIRDSDTNVDIHDLNTGSKLLSRDDGDVQSSRKLDNGDSEKGVDDLELEELADSFLQASQTNLSQ